MIRITLFIREIATEAFNWMKRLNFKEVGKNIQ